MIRQPSTFTQAYGWWLDAIAGREVERHDGLPECGYFQMKNVKGGPWVPVHITLSRDIDAETGELTGPERYVAHVEGRTMGPVFIWDRLEPISRDAYEDLCARIARDERMQASMVPLDLSTTPTRPPRGAI